MLKDFYMLRHGETINNQAKKATGWVDCELTELGRKQARECRDIIMQLGLVSKTIIHTGLKRTAETASIINESLRSDMVAEPDLREQFFGDWENVEWKDLYPQIEKIGCNPPNGESHKEFVLRISQTFQKIFSSHDNPIILVTHGGVFEAFGISHNINLKGIKNSVLYHLASGDDGLYKIHSYSKINGKISKDKVF